MQRTRLIVMTMASLLFLLRPVQAQTNLSARLMNQFGEASFSGTPWTVQVSETNRTFQISYRYDSGTNGVACINFASPADWRAKPGWFIFVENNERVWAYDGGSNLFLQSAIPYKLGPRCASYGPSYFPYAVPGEVFGRLSKHTQDAIKDDYSE